VAHIFIGISPGNMIFSREFPDAWDIHKFSRQVFERFDNETTLVFNDTWFQDQDLQTVYKWLDNPNNKVVWISLFDPIKKHVMPQNNRIREIGCEQLCFWLLAVDKFFTQVDTSIPSSFNHKFLCYQRKVVPTRERLYHTLKDRGGIVTLGNILFADINKDLQTSSMGQNFDDGDIFVPNDIWTIGNKEVWNSSFLNIVSETAHNISGPVFVSEKIFKPILGKRPFICYGHPKTSDFLKQRGFKTFDDYFDYRPTDNYDRQLSQIFRIVNEIDDCREMYNDLLPRIEHNFNHFKNAVSNEWEILNVLCMENQ